MSSPLPASSISAAGHPQLSRPFGARIGFPVCLLLFFCLLLDTGVGVRADLVLATPPQTYPTNFGPTALVLHNLNPGSSPAALDAVAAAPNENAVSVLLGTGDFMDPGNLFSGATSFPVTSPSVAVPISVAVGDFNGDTIPDLVTANYGNDSVWVMLGNGDGSFQNPIETTICSASPCSTAKLPFSVAADNLDNDPGGNLDAVTANSGTGAANGTVSVLLGQGNGHFANAVEYGVGAPNPVSVAIGQFGGPGDWLDLVTANAGDSGTVSVFLGQGNGTFPSSATTFGTGPNPAAVAVAHLDNNGNLDLVTANSGDNTVSVLLGNGMGGFAAASPTGTGKQPGSITVADLDGDGKQDIVTGNLGEKDPMGAPAVAGNTVSVLLGNGDGTFKPPLDFPLGGTTYGDTPVPVAVRDVNNDGKPDVIAAFTDTGASASYLAVLLNSTAPLSLTPPSHDFGAVPVNPSPAPTTTFTLANGGSAAIDIGTINTGNGAFTVLYPSSSSPCPSPPFTLAGGASCMLTVQFNPSVNGSFTGKLDVLGPTGFPLASSDLKGATNGLPVLDPIGPFPSTTVGDESTPQPVTLRNQGGSDYLITTISITAGGTNFRIISNPCNGTTLAPMATCTVQVVFTPTSTGPLSGTLRVTGSPGAPVSATLSGTGMEGPTPPGPTSASTYPNPWLEPIDPFGPQTLGTTSAPHSTRLRNLGTANYIIISIVTSGDFGVVNDCPQVLVPKAYCTLQLTFTPETEGALKGSVTVNGNFSIPAIRGLSGTGVNGPVSPEAAPALAPIAPFGAQTPGTTSAAQAVTLSNTGGTPYGIASITASGDFAVSHDCGTSLAPGASCTLRVTFTPTANGSRTGSLTVTGTTGDPLVNTLIGTGASPGSVTPPNTVPSSPAPSVTADLRLKIQGPTTARAGKAMTYRFAVRNQARRRITAPEVIVTAGLEGLAAEGAALTRVPAYCAVTDHTLTCNLGNLRGKKRKQFKIAVQPVVQGTMNVTGVVAGFVIDPKPDNNRASKSTPVR